MCLVHRVVNGDAVVIIPAEYVINGASLCHDHAEAVVNQELQGDSNLVWHFGGNLANN